jgi:hypothetical protein
MKRFLLVSLALCLAASFASEAFAFRGGAGRAGGGAVYRGPMGGGAVRGPAGGAAVRGPAGATAVRGPAGNVAVRGPTNVNVYGGAYRPYAGVAAGVAVGAAVGAAAASTYYPPAYYVPPCGPPYTPYCP